MGRVAVGSVSTIIRQQTHVSARLPVNGAHLVEVAVAHATVVDIHEDIEIACSSDIKEYERSRDNCRFVPVTQ